MRGFTAIPNAVLRDTTLTPSSRFLYGVILSYCWGERRCTASSETLCGEAGIGRSAFFEAIKELVARDLLSVDKAKTTTGVKNVYTPMLKGISISDEPEASPDSGRGVVRSPDGGSSATRTGSLKKEDEGEEDDGLRPSMSSSAIEARLFAYWQEQCGHPKAIFTSDRRSKVKARLADGYTPRQIAEAIRGAAVGAYVENGKKFDDIELICRSGSKLESFIGRQAQAPKSDPKAEKRERDKRRMDSIMKRQANDH